MTFASITFSVSLLIMQQGSSQFSPRVIHGLVRDPFNRRVIAIVVGTFTFCLVSLQHIRGPIGTDSEAIVSDLAVSVGLLLGVITVVAVVAAISHTSRKMDVSVILGDIVAETIAAPKSPETDEYFRVASTPGPAISPRDPVTVVRFDADGWIRLIDRRRLIALAAPGGVVRLETEAGRYAMRSTPLCSISPTVPAAELDEVVDAARACVRLGPTRTTADDAAYGVRQLVDVALRALSPGVNDPTTAQDAIFHLGTVLVDRLTGPPVPTEYEDAQGRRLVVPHAATDEEIVQLAFAELRRAAADHPAVAVYLLQMMALVVEGVTANGEQDRVGTIFEQASLVVAGTDASDALADDRRSVRDTYRSLFGS